MLPFLSNEQIKELLALSATFSTVLQFLTGVLICRNYFRKKSTGEVLCWQFPSKFIATNSLVTSQLLSDLGTSVRVRAVELQSLASLWVPDKGTTCDFGQCNWRIPVCLLLPHILHVHRQQEAIFASDSARSHNDHILHRLQSLRARQLEGIETDRYVRVILTIFLISVINCSRCTSQLFNFRSSLLLGRSVFLCIAAHQIAPCNTNEKHRVSSISHNSRKLLRHASMVRLWASHR